MIPEAYWHLPAHDETLNLCLPRGVARQDVAAEIERWANAVAAGWSARCADQVADLDYTWVFPQSPFFSVALPDGEKWGFRDLRLFCLAWESVARVCVVAVDPDGARRLVHDFFGLLARVEDAHLLHGEDEP